MKGSDREERRTTNEAANAPQCSPRRREMYVRASTSSRVRASQGTRYRRPRYIPTHERALDDERLLGERLLGERLLVRPVSSTRSRLGPVSNPSLIEPFAHRTLRSSNPSLIESFAHRTLRSSPHESHRLVEIFALRPDVRPECLQLPFPFLARLGESSRRLLPGFQSPGDGFGVGDERLPRAPRVPRRRLRALASFLSTLSSLDADDASLSNFRADASAAASRVSALDVRRHASAHSRRHDASSASASARAARSAATASRGGGDVLSALSRSSSAARWAASWAASDSPRRASSSSARSRRVVSAEAATSASERRASSSSRRSAARSRRSSSISARARPSAACTAAARERLRPSARDASETRRAGGGRGGVGGGFVGGGGIVVGIGVDVPAEGARARPGGRGIRRVATRLARTIARRAGRGGGLLSLVALRQLEVAEERLEPRVAARARGLGTLGQTSETRLDRGELARAARRDERLALRRP